MSLIWVLGATGRTGRGVAARLAKAGFSPVLVGRDGARLHAITAEVGADLSIVVADSTASIAEEVARRRPAVVINTIGPFEQTAPPLVAACPPGTHYVDLCNDLPSIIALLDRHEEAVATGRTLVTGAGFGVLATESVVLKLRAGQPDAARVRVDALAAVDPEPGQLGEALAASVLGVFATGGRRYEEGRLVRSRSMGDFEILALPDGSRVGTAAGAWGELEAARRASGASFAIAASTLAPPTPILRAVLPSVLKLLQVTAVRRFAVRQVAAVKLKPSAQPPVSWAHARLEWQSGQRRDGWLRMGDAMTFTIDVLAEVAMRLARGEGQPGAYTPGALFGADLARAAGGEFLLD